MLANQSNFSLIRTLNQDPLNQEAKRWLLEAKDVPADHIQYLLQLADWGLHRSKLEFEHSPSGVRERLRLESILPKLYDLPNQRYVLQLFSHGQTKDDGTNLALGTLVKALDPEDAAHWVLDALDNALF